MHPIDVRYPNLRILTLTEEADVKRLLFLLSQEYELESLDSLEDEYFLATIKPELRLPASLIAEMVLPHGSRSLGIQSAIVESDYVDRDANVLYARLYARAFRDHPRRTVRLHFFSKPITSCEQLISEQFLQDSYIGFCVLSASRPGDIGRTVLPPPKDKSSWLFVPAQAKYSINIGGAQLYAKGTTFIQQDGRAAACASAATWMSANILAKQHGLASYSMTDITELGTRFSLPRGWGGSRSGLEVEQILWALHEMNYEPISHVVKNSDIAKEVIYSYIESGIPPILIIFLPEPDGFHAVTAIGHTYSSTIDITAITNKSINTVIPWCPCFLAHDDQNGPYLKFRVDSPNAQSKGKPAFVLDESNSFPTKHKQEILDWYRDASLYYIVAPLPPRHALRPEEAAAKAKTILTQAFSLFNPLLKKLGKEHPENPIYRTYFVPSNEYKRNFAIESTLIKIDGKIQSSSLELVHWYRGSVYPRYIWVTELCDMEHRINKEPNELRIVADVTIDPTSSPYSLDFVTLHLPHLFFRMPPRAVSVADILRNPVFIQNDVPYQPLIRLDAAQSPIKK
jgi:hypothetical protein